MLTANGVISSVQAVTTTFTMSYPVFYNPAAAVGRMFDLPHDVVAVLAMNEAAPPNAQPLNLVIHDLEAGAAITQQIAVFDATFGDLAVNLLPIVMADFNGDGYDELAINYSSNSITTSMTTPIIQIVQATNPLSLTAGVRVGPAFAVDTVELALAAAKLGGQPTANLLLNRELGQLSNLQWNGGSLNILLLPETLPTSVDSPLFLGFLQRIKRELETLTQLCDICFKKLWQSSLAVWQEQRTQSLRHRSHTERPNINETAKRLREELHKRRQAKPPRKYLGAADIESALTVLGFEHLPNAAELKRRYIKLAQSLHPDVNEGKEDDFKNVAAAYKLLRDQLALKTQVKTAL